MYRKRKMLLKKSAAMVTASAMVMTALPFTAMAEGTTYCDREKAALKVLCETLQEEWDASLEETKEGGSDAAADITLTLNEAGQSMVGMMTQMDMSWLKTIGMDMDVSIIDGKEAVNAAILLNDANLCTMNVIVDLLTETEFIQIPELSPSWLKAAMDVTVNESALSAETMETLMGVSSDPSVLLPEGAVVSELLDRYGTIVIDHMQEGPSVEEAISVEGISEDCTLLEGQLYQEDAREMVKELLTTAQSDEQLEELLTKWSEAMPEAGDLNAQFQSYAEETLADLETSDSEAEASEETVEQYLASRIWVNGEDKIVGREFALCEGIDADTVITWKAPADGDTSALLLDMQSEGSGFTVTGSGQTVDGVSYGSYGIAADGVTVMEIAVENYGETAEEGNPSAVFTATFPQGESEEEYNPLSMFSFVLTISSEEAGNGGDITLDVLSSGASLGTLNIHAVDSTEPAEAVAEEDMGTVYDTMNEDEMTAYTEEMSFDTILANAEAAGVPANLLSMIEASIEEAMSGGTEEAAPDESADTLTVDEAA